MKTRLLQLIIIAAATVQPLSAQQGAVTVSRVQLANLQQELAALRSEVGKLRLQVEQVERDNVALSARITTQDRALNNYASAADVARQVALLRSEFATADSAQKTAIINEVGAQMERFAKKTEGAINAVAQSTARQPQSNKTQAVTFNNDFPQDKGVPYTVKSGDTLSAIASKLNSRVPWIVNANKIADPTRIQVGQTLYIPIQGN